MVLLRCVVVLLTATNAFTQSLDNLNHLEGYHINAYYSNDSKEQAETMARRCKRSVEMERIAACRFYIVAGE
ncbi:MAG TPA: hypothetical protein PKV73_15835 [Agriterribacter sp.]|nr:hypothetical protein [Chitinophagaceae bacterium]HRP33369.1 hypothetical protein [Agriterribacter sp.]